MENDITNGGRPGEIRESDIELSKEFEKYPNEKNVAIFSRAFQNEIYEKVLKRIEYILGCTIQDYCDKKGYKMADIQELIESETRKVIEEKLSNEEAESSLLNLIAKKPNDRIYSTDKLVRHIFEKGMIDGEQQPIDCWGGNLSFYTLSIEEMEQDGKIHLVGGSKMTLMDEAVHEAVYSLYKCGNKYITDRQIYFAFSGKELKGGIPLKVQKQIQCSMKRLSSIWASVDATEEWQKHFQKKGESIKKFKFSDQILHWQSVTLETSNGETVVAYHILCEPCLFTFANATNRIAHFDFNLLNVSGVVNTVENIKLKNYIIKRIERMKQSERMTPSILLTTMYSLMECETEKSKRTMRKNAETILDYLVRIGYINGWNIDNGLRNVVRAYKIELSKKRK